MLSNEVFLEIFLEFTSMYFKRTHNQFYIAYKEFQKNIYHYAKVVTCVCDIFAVKIHETADTAMEEY